MGRHLQRGPLFAGFGFDACRCLDAGFYIGWLRRDWQQLPPGHMTALWSVEVSWDWLPAISRRYDWYRHLDAYDAWLWTGRCVEIIGWSWSHAFRFYKAW